MTNTTIALNTKAVADDGADDEKFLDFCRDVTKAFVNLYIENDPDIEARSPEERQRAKLSLPEKRSPEVVSEQVAKKLQRVGDNLDDRLKGKIKEAMQDLITHQSVWEIGYSHFAGACSGVLVSCQGYVRNGWDQVSVVYMTAGRLITELRYQNEDIGPRERQMEGYTGTFLSDSGLQEWTAEHGGLENMDQDVSGENTKVMFDGSEV